jgi:hypothetical protein
MRSRRVRTVVVLAPVLVAVLVALSVTACGRDPGPRAPDPTTPLVELGAVPPAAMATPNPTRPVPTTTTRQPTTTTTGRPVATADRPSGPRLLFGMGPEANVARTAPLVRQAPVRMLTSWYNGPRDLDWIAAWRGSEVPRAYAAGYSLHLIVYTGDPEGPVATPHGQACGRAYPLSGRFLDDMRRLARIFAGPAGGPRLYVSLFTEFQTYPCNDNAWRVDPAATAYYRTLKDRYLATQAIFHQLAPNSGVSLSWGGWQARWDDRATGAGRSLFRHFADVLRAADFQSLRPGHACPLQARQRVRRGVRGRSARDPHRPLPGRGDPGRAVRHELHGRHQLGRLAGAAAVRAGRRPAVRAHLSKQLRCVTQTAQPPLS